MPFADPRLGREDTHEIAVDQQMLQSNTAYDDSYERTATFSLTSSVFNFRYENERIYHRYRDGAYVMPCDELEMERLDVLHCTYVHMLDGRLYLAPIKDPKLVLDVGTGTGIWAIDFADQHPDAQVIGTDLSPIQPNSVPPNCIFEIDDAESEWTWPTNHFDFIHSRHLAQSLKDWDGYLSRIYQHLKPNGWVELSEFEYGVRSDDNTYHAGSAIHQLLSISADVQKRAGFSDIASQLGERARAAGFVDVEVRLFKLPWGPWPEDEKLKALGSFTLFILSQTTFEAFSLALLTRYGGMDPEEARRLCGQVQKEVWNRNIHVYNMQYFVIGRKPE